MSNRANAWLYAVFSALDAAMVVWNCMPFDLLGVIISAGFALLFAAAAVYHFRKVRKRQPRVVIKATTLADAQRIIENLTRKDVR